VGDALLRSTRWLKWMVLNIGDPLYCPFPRGIAPFNLAARQEIFLALVPQSVTGGNPSSGVVGLSSPAPEGGIVLSLNSDQPDLVSVPKTIAIAAKASTAKFPILTRPVTSQTAVRVSMAAAGVSRSNTLVLVPLPARP